MKQHTPTPWKIFDAGHNAFHPGIEGADETTIVVHGREGEDCGIRGFLKDTFRNDKELIDANAVFIVKAVNNHDALVEALQNVIWNFEGKTDRLSPVQAKAIEYAKEAVKNVQQ
jgi:hypothetical protein